MERKTICNCEGTGAHIHETCGKPDLGPDDSIKPCRLAKDHDGRCDSGAR